MPGGVLIYTSGYPQEDKPVSALNPLPTGNFVVPAGGGDAAVVSQTNPQPVSTSSNVPTYAVGATLAATADGVLLTLTPSSLTMRIRRIEVSITNGSAAHANLALRRYSTAATGGTTGVTAVAPLAAANAASTVASVGYSAPPTPGTAVHTIRTTKVGMVPASASPAPIVWTFGDNDQAATFASASDIAVLFINGGTWATASVSVSVEWTEG